jgi:glutathione S-transferase
MTHAHTRLTTIIDEAFGIQSVMSTDELLTFLERKLYQQRVERDLLQARLDLADARATLASSWGAEYDEARAKYTSAQERCEKLTVELDRLGKEVCGG